MPGLNPVTVGPELPPGSGKVLAMSNAQYESLLDQLATARTRARVLDKQQPVTGEIEASDAQGVVTATIDGGGRLTRLVVKDDWSDTVQGAEGLQACVLGAAGAAFSARWGFSGEDTTRRAETTEEAEEALDGATLDVEVTAEDRQAAEEQVAGELAKLEEAATTMTLEEAKEYFLSQLDRLNQVMVNLKAPEPEDFTNEAQTAKLSFLNGVLVGCELREPWVSRQSGKALTMTFTEILEDAASTTR